MNILVSGSLAFDRVMRFADHFQHHLLPEELHRVNVCFVTPEMRVDFGGCAGNIAYNLNLLHEAKNTFIVAALGKDGKEYRHYLKKLGLSDQYIFENSTLFSAQAFITNDNAGNQITTFHPGALVCTQNVHIDSAMDAGVGIVSPSEYRTMLQHAQEFHKLNIPFFFDPGQNLPLFSQDHLKEMLNIAPWLILNDYECSLFCERTQLSIEDLSQQLDLLIITHGEKGSTLYEQQNIIEIDPVAAQTTHDPTGCGDAYRAGLLYGYAHNLSWQKSAQLASVLGAFKIESHGGQNHHPTLEEILLRYENTFHDKLF